MVHHGGAGTTAAAFRAGVPQTIVWHLGDQPVWGKRTKLLGVAPGFVSHRKLTARWLRAQIDRMCADDAMQQRARALGEEIRQENGVATAVQMIEGVPRSEPHPCASFALTSRFSETPASAASITRLR